jgi:hypothetical protein
MPWGQCVNKAETHHAPHLLQHGAQLIITAAAASQARVHLLSQRLPPQRLRLPQHVQLLLLASQRGLLGLTLNNLQRSGEAATGARCVMAEDCEFVRASACWDLNRHEAVMSLRWLQGLRCLVCSADISKDTSCERQRRGHMKYTSKHNAQKHP